MEPFLAAEAIAAGKLTYCELKQYHVQLFPGVWVDRCANLSMLGRSWGGWLWSRRTAVLSGLSAAAALGAKWIDPGTPVELIHGNRRPPSGIVVHPHNLLTGETATATGLPVTTAARTAYDLGRRLDIRDGVERVDALMNATGVKIIDVEALMARHPRARGILQLRKTLALVDGGAESPYESKIRMLLVEAGFPRPETQLNVFDANGSWVARLDMGWREYQVGVDFEGAHHWTDPRQFSKDVERYARLPELGWTDIRVTSGMLHNAPEAFLRRVDAALVSRGCPRTWRAK